MASRHLKRNQRGHDTLITPDGELKRGAAPLSLLSPSPLGKGIKGIGPALPDRAESLYEWARRLDGFSLND